MADVTITGTPGDDDGISNPSLVGGSGNDTLTGLAGDDFLTGGTGNDTLIGSEGADRVFWSTGDGFDTLQATDDDNGEDMIIVMGTGHYDLSWSWDANDLQVGVAVDGNYDWNDAGGNITIEDFRNGSDRGGSVCLNSLGGFYKWIPTLVMLPPELAAAH